jgi:peroxiredoxin
MRRQFHWFLVLALAIAIGSWSITLAGEKSDHKHAVVGHTAPDFTLADLTGTQHKLSDYKGKVVVLEWTNNQCPFVVRHQGKLKTMQKAYAKYKDKGVVWLAVNSSHFGDGESDNIRKWAKEQNIEYPILLDAPGKVGRLYGAKTTPHMFVIDRQGMLAYSGAIDDDPRDQKSEKRNYVEEAVNTLLNGSTVAVGTTEPYGCSVKYKS